MNIYSTLLNSFENYATHILFKIFMNIYEYLEYLEYFFDTLARIFDPPGAVPPVNNLLPTTGAVPHTSTYESPSAVLTVTALLASTPPTPSLVASYQFEPSSSISTSAVESSGDPAQSRQLSLASASQ
jgi:hypothetical protein